MVVRRRAEWGHQMSQMWATFDDTGNLETALMNIATIMLPGKRPHIIPASLSSRRKATQGRPKGISFFFYTLIRVVLIRDGTAAGR
jgi:hypothetical protein